MKCEVCQEREASVHLTNYLNGQKAEIHLCQQCAIEKGYLDADDESYTIQDLLSGFFNAQANLATKDESNQRTEHQLVCPQCQMTYQRFNKIGKFGCSKCYQNFSSFLNPIFRRLHSGNTSHTGKIPKRQHVHLQHQRLIQNYRDQLQEFVKEEKFEEAAELRDKIKDLEQKGKSSVKKGDEL